MISHFASGVTGERGTPPIMEILVGEEALDTARLRSQVLIQKRLLAGAAGHTGLCPSDSGWSHPRGDTRRVCQGSQEKWFQPRAHWTRGEPESPPEPWVPPHVRKA